MLKIAISGKAKSGKNTLANLILKRLNITNYSIIAFADPIKEMVLQMFPSVSRDILWGSSEHRDYIISNTSIRKLLCDLGDYGRNIDPDIWIKAFDNNYQKNINKHIICSDVRFKNELLYLKKNRFLTIRIIRNDDQFVSSTRVTSFPPLTLYRQLIKGEITLEQYLKTEIPQYITSNVHISESEQNSIKDEEFDFVIKNFGTLEQLEEQVYDLFK